MTAKKSITVEGVEYPSHKQACKANGIQYKNVKKKIDSGMSIEEAYKWTICFSRMYRLGINGANYALEGYWVEGMRFPNQKAALAAYSGRDANHFIGGAEIKAHGSIDAAMRNRAKIHLCIRLKRWKSGPAFVARMKAKAMASIKGINPKGCEYTAVSKCPQCDKFHDYGQPGITWLNGSESSTSFCSKECRDAKAKALKKESRKKERESGRHDKGRAKKRHQRQGGFYVPGITPAKVALRDKMRCQECGVRLEKHLGRGWQPRGWSVGHIVAVANGGNTTWENVQAECCECNSKKGALDRGQLSLFGAVN